MSDVVSVTDELIRDYLHYRGLTQTTKALDVELKTDRDGKLSVDKIVEEILSCIDRHDLIHLRKLWTNLNRKVFNSLSGEQSKLASQYENDVYRLYLVRCAQKNEQAKCIEFFQIMTPLTLNNPQWTDWFAFPFVPDAKDRDVYKKYFLRQWQEIFTISLHNLLSIALQSMEPPALLRIIDVASGIEQLSQDSTSTTVDEDLIDDFAVIAQCSGPLKTSSSKPSLKSIFKSITGKKSSD